jgi:hypothetical protein
MMPWWTNPWREARMWRDEAAWWQREYRATWRLYRDSEAEAERLRLHLAASRAASDCDRERCALPEPDRPAWCPYAPPADRGDDWEFAERLPRRKPSMPTWPDLEDSD